MSGSVLTKPPATTTPNASERCSGIRPTRTRMRRHRAGARRERADTQAIKRPQAAPRAHTLPRALCQGLAVLCLALAVSSVEGRRAAGRGQSGGETVRAHGGPRKQTPRGVWQEPGLETVHELPGRPLHVRAGQGKAQQLKRAAGVDQVPDSLRAARRGGAGKNAAVVQYLVRVVHPIPTGMSDYFAEVAAGRFLRYLPHDTFVMALPKQGVEKLRKAAGVVEIYELPEAMKLEPALLALIDTAGSHRAKGVSPTHHDEFLQLIGVQRRAMPQSDARTGMTERSSKKSKFTVHVMLAHGGTDWLSEAKALVAEWKAAFVLKGFTAAVQLASLQKAVVTVEYDHELKKVVAWLIQQPLVHWVQEQKEIRMRNKYAGPAMQSWNASTHAIWERGITGIGQVVGIADTGIDYDNCFFRDPAMPTPPMCSGIGHVTTAGCISNTHRKIVTYRKFAESDYSDYYAGHGTHVAGSVAGSALSADKTELDFASQYNGAAPGAKIAFDDVGDAQGSLGGIPLDLNSDLFPHSYAAGARIHSDSWGTTDIYYDMMSMEIDEFSHTHDDYLVMVAAGNDGPSPFTVGAPATAKNILAVGATENGAGAQQVEVEMKASFLSGAPDVQHGILPGAFGGSFQTMTPITVTLIAASPLDACTPVSAISGNIALVQRGTCNFDVKVLNAQNAGATAVIVFNNVDGPPIIMGGADVQQLVTIPSAMITKQQGDALLAATESGVHITVPVLLESVSSSHHVIASFSSRGPTGELRLKPDVLCPGTNIHSAHGDGDITSNNCGTLVDSGDGAVGTMSGTSMATPLCAGAGALVREYFWDGYSSAGMADASKKVDASGALVKAVMIHSAQSVKTETGAGLAYETEYPNPRTGYGRVELSSALYFADSPFQAIYKDRETVTDGGHKLFCFRVGDSTGASPDSQEFRVSLVWTDPPGDPMSFRPLINDLDLVVNGPDGTVSLGNTIKQTDETHGTYVVRDSTNNAEQVRVADAPAGLYAVRVIGTDVPSELAGPQKFSLVASAGSIAATDPAECAFLKCPNECSGIGECLLSGVCSCPITHGGPDCSRAYAVLQPVAEPTQTTSLSVSWLGMSYYVFEIAEGGSFELSLSPGESNGDADFVIAKDRLPTVSDYDGIVADEWSNANFRSVGNAKGTWVLGVFAFQGDVSILASLQTGTDGEEGGDGGVDGGGGGGGGSGHGSNCTAPCKCGFMAAPSGVLLSNDGNPFYENSANCWWVISPDVDVSNVTVRFNSFSMEYYYDYVSIFECYDPWCVTSTELQRLSGEAGQTMTEMITDMQVTVPLSITSHTGYILITLVSDESVTDAGFEAEWFMDQNSGPPPAPPPPLPPSNSSCSVDECETMASELGLPFSIQYTSAGAPAGCIQYNDGRVIYVETCSGHVNCGTTVCNGCSVLECGVWPAPPPPEILECPASCACGYFTESEGTFSDGSGDDMYVSNTMCRWVIDAASDETDDGNGECVSDDDFVDSYGDNCELYDSDPSFCDYAEWYENDEGLHAGTSCCICGGGSTSGSSVVVLNFNSFNTESGYDLVTIRECESLDWSQVAHDMPYCVNARQIRQISGHIDPSVRFYALTGFMEVVFESDYSVNGLGFEAGWQIGDDNDDEDEVHPPRICTAPCDCQELTSPVGWLEDGSGSETYTNNADCTWTIVIPGAEWVKLRIIKMDVESDYDFISIFQCADREDCSDPHGGALVKVLTGSEVERGSDAWILAQGAMRVHFTSDGSVRRQGFKAVWISSLNTTDPEGPGSGVGSCIQGEWPHAHDEIWMRSCALPPDWERLKADGYSGNLRTGGLGQRIIMNHQTGAPHFDTWVCHYSHPCARRIADPSIGNAVTAEECHQQCSVAGYSHEHCGFGASLLDEYFGSGGALSCIQACMMRVGGRIPIDGAAGSDHDACNDYVERIFDGTAGPVCDLEIAGRTYHLCGDSMCQVAPSLEGGLYGCQIGSVPSHDEVDPFCWVYNEKCKAFEPWGFGSEIGLA